MQGGVKGTAVSSKAEYRRKEGGMYQKPKVDYLGTMRDLTRAGFMGASEGTTVLGIAGNNCQNVTENADGTYNFLRCRRVSY